MKGSGLSETTGSIEDNRTRHGGQGGGRKEATVKAPACEHVNAFKTGEWPEKIPCSEGDPRGLCQDSLAATEAWPCEAGSESLQRGPKRQVHEARRRRKPSHDGNCRILEVPRPWGTRQGKVQTQKRGRPREDAGAAGSRIGGEGDTKHLLFHLEPQVLVMKWKGLGFPHWVSVAQV